MRVSFRITALSGLFFTCLALFPQVARAQVGGDGNRDRRESRGDESNNNNGDEGPRRGRGGFPGGDFGGPGGGGPFGGGGPGGGGPGAGGPWGGRGQGGGGPWGGGGPGGGGPWGGGGQGGGGPWGGGGGGGPWGGGGGGWGGRGGGEDGGGRRGRGGFGGGGFGGFNPADMFALQDRNGDGQITMDELDERTRGFMQRMAQNNGLSESGPWKIDEIRKSFEDRAAGGGDRRGGQGDENRRDGDRGGENNKEKEAAKKPLVPGFGMASLEGAAGRLVPGFGVDPKKAGAVSNRTFGALARTSERPSGGGSRGGTGPAAASAAPAKAPASKAEADAQKMIKGSDANNDGKLQPDEMEGMFFKPKDTNGDGAVTLEELTEQLAKISGKSGGKSGGGSDSKADGGGRRSRESSGSGSDASRKGSRFLTARERLPKDIPDWFVDADEDEDGQVLMSEYAERWTESVVKKFAGLDSDGDGVITPEEATAGRNSRDR